MARIGLLGGTFNPPHIGHLICAQEAHTQLGLDVVLFVPVARPPHKRPVSDPGGAVRLELCQLAVAPDQRLGTSAVELERGGPSYTVDTLRTLHERAPENELTFVVGGDMALDFPSWREPEGILELATLAVAERAGARREQIRDQLAPLHDGARVRFLDMPRIDISSSAVRDRVAHGRPIRYLVPDAVIGAIATRNLYSPPPRTATSASGASLSDQTTAREGDGGGAVGWSASWGDLGRAGGAGDPRDESWEASA